MELFDKIGENATKAYKATADKASNLAKEAKLKIKMNELKSQVDDLYKEIGKKVYQKHLINQPIDIQSELEEECTKIDVLSNKIEINLKDCLELQDKKQCDNCETQFNTSFKFCPECGKKQ